MSDATHPAKAKSFVLRNAVRHAAQYLPVLGEILRERHLRYRMRAALGYEPNLSQPQTFNEKLGWRILHDRNPLLALTTDKINVRSYVADRVGHDVLVPLLGIWGRAEDIEWETLPRRFVLKGSHGWNMNLLVHDRTVLDIPAAVTQANGWLRCNHYETAGEWAYRDLTPRLLAEEMLLDADGGIPADLKFYVFHGRVRMLRVHTGRHGQHRANSYNERLEPWFFRQSLKPNPNYVLPPEAQDALRLAERIGGEFDFARVDLYCVGGRVFFGEITHYDGNACSPFSPTNLDRMIGDYWTLPSRRQRAVADLGSSKLADRGNDRSTIMPPQPPR